MTGKAAAPATLLLKLYNTNITPTQASVAGDFVPATFTNYASSTLTATAWSAATTVSNKATSTYAPITYSCGATGDTVYGYYIVNGSTLMWAEKFGTARVLANNDLLVLSPQIQLNSAN